jgi:hypothetical protein
MTYIDDLTLYEHLTIEDVKEAVQHIRKEIREKLAEGPVPYRWDCAVCQAFGAKANTVVKYETFTKNELIVWIYHELPKANFRFRDQNFYGKGADDIYLRCIETYRAAGWEGEAEEPNATGTYIKPYRGRERYE